MFASDWWTDKQPFNYKLYYGIYIDSVKQWKFLLDNHIIDENLKLNEVSEHIEPIKITKDFYHKWSDGKDIKAVVGIHNCRRFSLNTYQQFKEKYPDCKIVTINEMED